MQGKTLKLNQSLFVARGRQRECYVHPEDPDLCIKVTVQTRSKWREQNPREFKYYKFLEQRGIDWKRIAPCSGWVETDKGQGLVFGLIRDRNGQICKDLQFLIDNNIITSEEIEFELASLRNWLLDNAIIVCDLKPANLVYNPDNEAGQRLVLVDGVNNRNFIKTADSVESLARNKIKRVWKRFEHKHLQDIIDSSGFKWFFNPKVKCDSAFFSFLKQHVDASLKEDMSSRHELEYHDYKDKSYVFKRFSPSDNSDISRKIELSIKSYIISGAERSFRGATWLQDADIPSITPVAWAVIGKGYRQVSYFVYEKLECNGSVQGAIQSSDIDIKTSESLLRCMGQITRKMHEAGLRHTDIVAHNFLYTNKEDDFDVYLIDTDKMERTKLFFWPEVKLFFDLRCLRRLKLEKRQLEVFFRSYFNQHWEKYYFKMWKFWLAGGFSLPRRLKKRKDETIRNLMKTTF